MSDDALAALRAELGGCVPPELEALGDAELDALASVLRAARERQTEALDAAVQAALETLPWLLRGPVRKALTG